MGRREPGEVVGRTCLLVQGAAGAFYVLFSRFPPHENHTIPGQSTHLVQSDPASSLSLRNMDWTWYDLGL